ncbi:hypothetical protein CCH79_00021144 [Gambusia affinis]|uniref:G-protein coupled receptors family 1 profile domain-containing protein n=1 Tax=Gambusia affinis TaxID=33528 RepID=A0A315WNC1_GAMAF|nr:hypothetical protein CCH79_00021144 [Gambusia affinis]
MDNMHNTSDVLQLKGYDLPHESVFPAFLFATLNYMIILFCNLTIIFTIVLNKSLHQPMHLFLVNLPINDLIGSSALFPHLIKEILTNSRRIQFSACIIQAFFIHIYAAGSVFILTAMAYDRYIAICYPLRYNTVMTNKPDSQTPKRKLCRHVLHIFLFSFCLSAWASLQSYLTDCRIFHHI